MRRFFWVTVWGIPRLLWTFTFVQTSLVLILVPKKLKIMFCGIYSTQNCCNWPWCGWFVLYSLISIIWYQKYISPTLHCNFTSQNRRKIRPKKEATGTYLRFLLPHHTYNAAYKFLMCSTRWVGYFQSQFEAFQDYCALLPLFKRHWPPFFALSMQCNGPK